SIGRAPGRAAQTVARELSARAPGLPFGPALRSSVGAPNTGPGLHGHARSLRRSSADRGAHTRRARTADRLLEGIRMRRLIALAAVTAALSAQPRRIVSTAPSFTETLFALGLGDRVIG